MDKLVKWINKYMEFYPVKETEFICLWKLIYRQELYAYFSVLIHTGITIESSIKDYWGDLKLASTSYIVKNYISLKRF